MCSNLAPDDFFFVFSRNNHTLDNIIANKSVYIPIQNKLNRNQKAKMESQRLDSNTLSKLTPQELKLYKLYGKLPSKKDLLNHKLKDNRKFFDSGDYHMKKEQEKHLNKQSSNLKESEMGKILPVHHLEQIKAAKRRSSSTLESSTSPLESSKVDVTNEGIVRDNSVSASQNSPASSIPTIKTRTRSNSILNPQPSSNSPLGK